MLFPLTITQGRHVKLYSPATYLCILAIMFLTACEDPYIERMKKAEKERQERERANPQKHHGPVTYNPSDCKRDVQEMVYFSSGRDVFKMHYQSLFRISALSKKKIGEAPPRPDPSQPEGCPDNPILGDGFTFAYTHKPKHPENYPESASFRAQKLSIIFTSPDHYGTQNSNESIFEETKKEYNLCEELNNGLVGCKVPSLDEKYTEIDWAIIFKAREDVYQVPGERPFVVLCHPKLKLGFQQCSVAYKYQSHINVFYRFWLENLPALEIIEFDKGIRSSLERMRVKEYIWPDQVVEEKLQ